jgi:intracellular multiplication protein IcmB
MLVGDLATTTRESRKWNLSIGLYSQSLDDFPEVLMELSTSVFLLGSGTEATRKKLQDTFGLGEELSLELTRLGKPGGEGSKMVALFKTQEGVFRGLLASTISPAMLWAFSTTTEDSAVREILYQKFGVEKALNLLGKLYPAGIKCEVERRKALLPGREEGAPGGGEALEGLIRELSLKLS